MGWYYYGDQAYFQEEHTLSFYTISVCGFYTIHERYAIKKHLGVYSIYLFKKDMSKRRIHIYYLIVGQRILYIHPWASMIFHVEPQNFHW